MWRPIGKSRALTRSKRANTWSVDESVTAAYSPEHTVMKDAIETTSVCALGGIWSSDESGCWVHGQRREQLR